MILAMISLGCPILEIIFIEKDQWWLWQSVWQQICNLERVSRELHDPGRKKHLDAIAYEIGVLYAKMCGSFFDLDGVLNANQHKKLTADSRANR